MNPVRSVAFDNEIALAKELIHTMSWRLRTLRGFCRGREFMRPIPGASD